MTLKLDFYGDWIEFIRVELQSAGFPPATSDTPDQVCHRYFNLRLRNIESRPRTVLRSKALAVPKGLETGVERIAQRFADGDDLRGNLSRSITDPEYKDHLLSDWGIHHLHLGTKLDTSGFVDRTGPLLFVRVTNDTAYFLAVKQHGEWADSDFIEVIHAEWRDTIQHKLLPGAPVSQVGSSEIKRLRSNHINTPVTLKDGTCYAGPGGGITSSGVPFKAVRDCIDFKRRTKQLEQDVCRDSAQIQAELHVANVSFSDPLELKLARHADGLFVTAQPSGVRFDRWRL